MLIIWSVMNNNLCFMEHAVSWIILGIIQWSLTNRRRAFVWQKVVSCFVRLGRSIAVIMVLICLNLNPNWYPNDHVSRSLYTLCDTRACWLFGVFQNEISSFYSFWANSLFGRLLSSIRSPSLVDKEWQEAAWRLMGVGDEFQLDLNS